VLSGAVLLASPSASVVARRPPTGTGAAPHAHSIRVVLPKLEAFVE